MKTDDELKRIAQAQGQSLPGEWHGIDAVLPLIEQMRRDGAVVVIKFDGMRKALLDSHTRGGQEASQSLLKW